MTEIPDRVARKLAWETLCSYATWRLAYGEILHAKKVYAQCRLLAGKPWAECTREDYDKIIKLGEKADV